MSQCVVAQARLAAAGEWVLNQKGIIERAGLGEAERAFARLDPVEAHEQLATLLAVDGV